MYFKSFRIKFPFSSLPLLNSRSIDSSSRQISKFSTFKYGEIKSILGSFHPFNDDFRAPFLSVPSYLKKTLNLKFQPTLFFKRNNSNLRMFDQQILSNEENEENEENKNIEKKENNQKTTTQPAEDEISKYEGLPILVFSNLEKAQTYPLQLHSSYFTVRNPLDEKRCVSCESRNIKHVLITTWNPNDFSVWENYPLILDGIRCSNCKSVTFPKTLEISKIQEFIKRAVIFAKQKNYPEAEFLFRRAANSLPSNPFVLMNLGNFYFDRLGEESSKILPHELEKKKKRLEALGNYVITSYSLAQELDPERKKLSISIFRHLGYVKKKIFYAYDESSKDFKTYMELLPPQQTDERKIIENEIEENEILQKIATTIDPVLGPSSPHALYEISKKLETYLSLLSNDSPFYPIYEYTRGRVFQVIGENEKALEIFRKLAKDYSHVVDPSKDLTLLCIIMDRLDDAQQYSDIALKYYPNDVGVLTHRAIIKSLTNNINEASEIIEKALNLDSSNEQTQRAFQTIYKAKQSGLPLKEFSQKLKDSLI